MLLAPVCKNICDALGAFIGWATDLRPFWMGMIISVVVGIVLTLPISSAAICAAVGISGGAVLAGLADGSVTMEVWNVWHLQVELRQQDVVHICLALQS